MDDRAAASLIATPGNTAVAEPLRVTHVVLSLDFGGMERVVLELVREGIRRGQQVSVLCVTNRGTLAEQVEAVGATVVCADKPPGLKVRQLPEIRAAIRRLKPDVIHSHQIGALLYVGPIARSEQVPVIVHTEHIDNAAKSKTVQKALRVRVLWGLAGRHTDRFCCVSADIADAVTRFGVVARNKVSVVPNGIDTSAFDDQSVATGLRQSLGIPPDAPVIGSIARLNEVKNQDLLIRAFAKVLKQSPETHLLLVGDGPERESLGRLTEELGVTHRVHFAGYQARPQDFFHVMDIFALTSRLEGMPLVILEAWAAGLPVVASSVGGVPKMVADGQNGVLFSSGDEPALVSALNTLLAQPEKAEALAQAGRDLVRAKFDTKVMAADYERQYREVLEKSGN